MPWECIKVIPWWLVSRCQRAISSSGMINTAHINLPVPFAVWISPQPQAWMPRNLRISACLQPFSRPTYFPPAYDKKCTVWPCQEDFHFLKENVSCKDATDWCSFLLRLLYQSHPTLWNIHRHLKQITCPQHNCSGCALHLDGACRLTQPSTACQAHSSAVPQPSIGVVPARCRILGALLKTSLWRALLYADTAISGADSAFLTRLADHKLIMVKWHLVFCVF